MSSVPDNLQLVSALETALSDFERGIADKSGTTDLVVLLSSLEKSNELIFEVSTYLEGHIGKEVSSEVKFWQAISIVCGWISRPQTTLSRAIEIAIPRLNEAKSAKYAMQSLRHLKAKISPSTYKELKDSTWPLQTMLRLAISSYSGDVFGLCDELVGLYKGQSSSMAFPAFKGTYSLLVEAVPETDLYMFVRQFGSRLENRNLANDVLQFVDELEGTQLTRGMDVPSPARRRANYINSNRLSSLRERTRSIKRTRVLEAVGG